MARRMHDGPAFHDAALDKRSRRRGQLFPISLDKTSPADELEEIMMAFERARPEPRGLVGVREYLGIGKGPGYGRQSSDMVKVPMRAYDRRNTQARRPEICYNRRGFAARIDQHDVIALNGHAPYVL